MNEITILGENMKLNITKEWAITLVGALFFFYAFMQVNLMTPLGHELLKAYNTNLSSISFLTAAYFYGNILFIIPAGLLLDRYSPKLLMMIGLFLAVLGTFIFATSGTISLGALGRFLCGIMMAFGLIAPLKLASLLLPSDKMAFASSLIVTIGMLGGVVAQAPTALLVQSFGWRIALIIIGCLGIFIGVLLYFIIKVPKIEKVENEALSSGILKSLKEVTKSPQNWYLGFFICLVNLPIAILGALFGIPYLVQVQGFLPLEASFITSMLFFGMIIGSPFFGWFSDRVKLRKLPMYIGAISCLVFILFTLFGPKLSSNAALLLFFLIGFTSSSQVLGYPLISESNPQKTSGTALSLATLIIMGVGYGLALPFVGWLLDLAWEGLMVNGMNIYTAAAYQKALFSIPLGVFIGIVLLFFTKESGCRPIEK